MNIHLLLSADTLPLESERGAPVSHRGVCVLAERKVASQANFGLDIFIKKLYGLV